MTMDYTPEIEATIARLNKMDNRRQLIQSLIRNAFDSEEIDSIARDIIDAARTVTVDGIGLDSDFIFQMEQDLNE